MKRAQYWGPNTKQQTDKWTMINEIWKSSPYPVSVVDAGVSASQNFSCGIKRERYEYYRWENHPDTPVPTTESW